MDQGDRSRSSTGWIKQVKDKNLDGGKLIEQAKALVAKYDKA